MWHGLQNGNRGNPEKENINDRTVLQPTYQVVAYVRGTTYMIVRGLPRQIANILWSLLLLVSIRRKE